MRCTNCGHEFKDGQIYCEKCGKAIQIVPDFNVLEDDILPDMLSESPTHVVRELYGIKRASRKKENSRRTSVIAACVLGVLTIGVVYTFGTISHRIVADEATAKETLATIDVVNGEDANEVKVAEVKEAFTSTVEFSEPGGTFSENVGLELSSSDDTSAVYYTTDGTDPTLHNGKKYESRIYITSGTTTVRAVCINAEGKAGSIAEEVYVVSYEAPAMPMASPESGTYHEETYVTVTAASSGVELHYTWDGNNPTAESPVYTSPLLIPEGNHILSIIAIDAHGMSSDILRCNYVYVP